MRRGLADWMIAVGAAALLLITGLTEQPLRDGVGLLGYALLAASGLTLAARRRWPVAVLIITGLCTLGYQAAGLDVPAAAFVVAVYTAVRTGHMRVTVVASVIMLASLGLSAMVSGDRNLAEAFAEARGALEAAWVIAAGAAGEAVRQAERRADEAERTREEAARRRADEERLHIARELHDSLTSQISIIKVQSEAAVHVAQKRGEPVPEALLAIREAGREATRELRATLDVLRGDGPWDDSEAHKGLDQIAELVQRSSAAGLPTTLTIRGRRDDVPAAVDRAAYRIVQESLTNVTRHAAAASAAVRVDYRPDSVVIRVEDDGQAKPDGTLVPGVGLLGMRERVTALGGRLRAAPRSDGGFTVRAELPLDRPS